MIRPQSTSAVVHEDHRLTKDELHRTHKMIRLIELMRITGQIPEDWLSVTVANISEPSYSDLEPLVYDYRFVSRLEQQPTAKRKKRYWWLPFRKGGGKG